MIDRTKNRSRRRSRSAVDAGELSLFVVAAGFVMSCLLLAGGPIDWGLPLLAAAVLGTATLGLALLRGGMDRLLALPWPARVLVGLAVVLPLVQLVPLPPAVWQSLPGRGFAGEILASAGVAQRWRPLTLDVDDALLSGAVILWMVGLFLAVQLMSAQRIRQLVTIVLVVIAAHIVIGAVQVISHGSALLLYPSTHNGFLTGLLANKNHSGLLIAIAIPLGMWLIPGERLIQRGTVLYVAPLVFVALLAEFATNSRAGLVLFCAALLGMVALHLGRMRRRSRRHVMLAVAAIVVLAAGLSLTPLADRLVGRFAYIQSDLRLELWARTLPLIDDSFPVGTGLATFPQVYATQERLAWVTATYANHAHNDYLELVLEAGALGVVLLLMALMVYGRAMLHAWRGRTTFEGRAAAVGGIVVGLCLAHSLVDYPLRRLGIAALFAIGAALLLAPPRAEDTGRVS